MSLKKVNWDSAPEMAQLYVNGEFWYITNDLPEVCRIYKGGGIWVDDHSYSPHDLVQLEGAQFRPSTRIDWSNAPEGAEFYADGMFWLVTLTSYSHGDESGVAYRCGLW